VSGSDMTVSFSYEVMRDERPLVASLSIETTRGALVYGLTTRMLDQVLPRAVGRHTVDFSFSNPALGAGEYVLRGGLETEDNELVHEISPASKFTVSSELPGTGYLRMNLRTKIRSLPPV